MDELERGEDICNCTMCRSVHTADTYKQAVSLVHWFEESTPKQQSELQVVEEE
jgi:hypothetical protein